VTYAYSGPVIPRDLDEIPIINFWIFDGKPSETGPVGGKPQELIVHSFKFTPLAVVPSPQELGKKRAAEGVDVVRVLGERVRCGP
jgi:hypothetical protein